MISCIPRRAMLYQVGLRSLGRSHTEGKVLRMLLAVGVASLSGCNDEAKVVKVRKPTTLPLEIRDAMPPGIQAELFLDHFTEATFADLTTLVPETSFTGACVEGNSFESPGDLYVFRLHLLNSSQKEITLPHLRLKRPNPTAGAEEVVYPSHGEKVAPGSNKWFLYLWDPGTALKEGTTARLMWTP
jgi:hypothetical protein